MSYRSNYRKKSNNSKYTKKGKYTKKYNVKDKSRNEMMLYRGVKDSGYPQVMYAKLKYVTSLVVSAGTIYDKHIFRGNSVFDPDLTGVGHQPLYFDQYAAVYGKYRVASSKINVQMVNRSGSSALQWIIYPATDSDTLTTIAEALEQPFSTYSQMLGVGSISSGNRGVKNYASTKRVFGLTKEQAGDDDYAAVVTANPQRTWRWNILAETADLSSAVSYTATVTLTYYVQFFDRFVQQES